MIPLVALYYGGFIESDIADPTRRGQDLFVLSKGHAVAALASIYAELGYFDRAVLRNSRSYESILNGHPGPVLPGVHIATGPMGQGFGVAQGFAIAGRIGRISIRIACRGDGELQEGPIWEAVMFAGAEASGQLLRAGGPQQRPARYRQPHGLSHARSGAGVPVVRLAGAQRGCDKLRRRVTRRSSGFASGRAMGKPTAIICHTTKGYGAFSDFMNRHKVAMADALIEQEIDTAGSARRARQGR